MVEPGRYDEPITHDNVPRTIEVIEGTAHAGVAANAAPILDVWQTEKESIVPPLGKVLTRAEAQTG